jgi:hypothetical protein
MLLRKYTKQVLLLDEITVDLDVLARANLLTYLKKECEERGATIIYATHIFDGLDDWPTHLVSFLAIFCRCKSRNSRSHIIVYVECSGLYCTWEAAISTAFGKGERNEPVISHGK